MGAPNTDARPHKGRLVLTDPERLWLVAYSSRVGYVELAERIEIDVRTLHRLAAGAPGTRGSIALVRAAIAREGKK